MVGNFFGFLFLIFDFLIFFPRFFSPCHSVRVFVFLDSSSLPPSTAPPSQSVGSTMPPTRTKSSNGQPAQPTQSSRKGKKAWRKNIDLTSTEAFLQDQSHPLRQTASDVLFVEDRSGQETLLARQARSKKPLKSLEILQNSYGHSALAPARKQRQTGPAVDKQLESRLRKMVGRQRVTTKGDAKAIAQQSSDVVNKSLGSVYDVWGEATASDSKGKEKQQEWIPATVSKPSINLPKTLRRDDYNNLASSLPAIDLPHPGSSYNPTLEAHEALIHEAYEIEKVLEQTEQMDQAEREKWQAKLATIVAREAELRSQADDELKRYRGMDLDVDSDSSADESSLSEGETRVAKDAKRKTRAQRARAKRARAQQSEAARRKQARIDAATLLHLPALQRRQARLAHARQSATLLRRQHKAALVAKHGLTGNKVGKHTVPQPKVDVQLPDELSESLRTLKPEGNLFRDRYVRLQVKGKVEPRVRQSLSGKGRKKVKTYETHDYKKFV